MTLEDIFETFTPGSKDFVNAVQTHRDFQISDDEIVRIAKKSDGSDDFEHIYHSENWWEDQNVIRQDLESLQVKLQEIKRLLEQEENKRNLSLKTQVFKMNAEIFDLTIKLLEDFEKKEKEMVERHIKITLSDGVSNDDIVETLFENGFQDQVFGLGFDNQIGFFATMTIDGYKKMEKRLLEILPEGSKIEWTYE